MKTDELILHLARSAGPVTRLPRPAVRLGRWVAVATLFAAAAVIAIGPRARLGTSITQPAFVVSLLALLMATGSAAAVALTMSVPGAERLPRRRVWPIAAVVVWITTWLLMLAARPAGHARVFHTGCAVQIAVLSTICGRILLAMLRNAAPLRPRWTASMAAIAAVALASAATQMICPIDDAAHQLIGHVMIAAAVGLAGFLVGDVHLRR